MKNKTATSWLFSADTGGTFTDCFAVDPSGRRLRTKVLSSGRLRALAASYAPESLKVVLSDNIDAPPGLLAGFTCRSGGQEAVIDAWDPECSTITLRSPLEGIRAGSILEFLTGEPAPVIGARLLMGTPPGGKFPPLEFRLATTRATNALLEHKIAPTVLFITAGFQDLLRIGDQRRPELFALKHVLPPLPVHRTCEVAERIGANGNTIVPLDEEALHSSAKKLVGEGFRTAAIAFVHSDRFSAHENRACEILLEAGFTHVTPSSAASPFHPSSSPGHDRSRGRFPFSHHAELCY